MADDGGPGERLKGQKQRTNPHDIAKRGRKVQVWSGFLWSSCKKE